MLNMQAIEPSKSRSTIGPLWKWKKEKDPALRSRWGILSLFAGGFLALSLGVTPSDIGKSHSQDVIEGVEGVAVGGVSAWSQGQADGNRRVSRDEEESRWNALGDRQAESPFQWAQEGVGMVKKWSRWEEWKPSWGFQKVQEEALKDKKEVDQLSHGYAQDHPFVALALRVENIPVHPYRDPAGVNLGAGYCVTKKMQTAKGKEQVKQELEQIGLSERDIRVVMTPGVGKAQLETVTLNPQQAVKLLEIVKDEYKGIAQSAFGDLFDKVMPHQRDVLVYLAYNVGYRLGDYVMLKQSIQQSVDQGVSVEFNGLMKEMSPQFKNAQGVVKTNDRLGFWAALMWSSPGLFAQGVAQQEVLDHWVARKRAPTLRGLAFASQRQERHLEAQEQKSWTQTWTGRAIEGQGIGMQEAAQTTAKKRAPQEDRPVLMSAEEKPASQVKEEALPMEIKMVSPSLEGLLKVKAKLCERDSADSSVPSGSRSNRPRLKS